MLCRVFVGETPIMSYGKVKIFRTKDLKGHKRRIMAVWWHHGEQTNLITDVLRRCLSEAGVGIFSYTPKFLILDTTFATVKDHSHLIASDLEVPSEDHEQILKTRWLEIMDT